MASDIDDNIIIETSGLTAAVATDVVRFAGATAHFQLIKLAHGICGSANIVSSASPLPVVVSGGMTATISGFTGTIQVQGAASGYPVAVSGTIIATGLSASPVYVTTPTGYRVEVTGGIPLSKNTDSVSIYGPSGSTYLYASLVDSSGNSLSITNGALNVNLVGATISAVIPSTVTVVGLSGATAVHVTVGNTLSVDNTAILSSLAGICAGLATLNSQILSIAGSVPSSFKSGNLSVTAAVTQMDVTGYTCSNGINLKSAATNTTLVYFGNTSGISVGGSSVYALDPGEETFVKLNNTNKIYLISSVSTTAYYTAS